MRIREDKQFAKTCPNLDPPKFEYRNWIKWQYQLENLVSKFVV